jgi:hypothetical protein
VRAHALREPHREPAPGREIARVLEAPDEAVEGPDAMREWLRPALGAALRNAQKKPRTAAMRRARGRPA